MELQPQPDTLTFRPLLSIWVTPRRTIHRLLETDPKKNIILLSMLAGIADAFGKASNQHLGDHMPFMGVLAFGMVLGACAGILNLYVLGAVYRWIGSKFGGVATTESVRTAVAWSSVPSVLALFFWIPLLMIFGDELFTKANSWVETNPILAIPYFGCLAMMFIFGMWAFILFIINLAEVHQFSIGKSLLTFVIPYLVVMIPTACILLFALP